MSIYGTDAKGWRWHERQRIRVAWWLFLVVDAWLSLGYRLTKRVNGLDSGVWCWLIAEGYLHSDLDDMPEHRRIGGVWR